MMNSAPPSNDVFPPFTLTVACTQSASRADQVEQQRKIFRESREKHIKEVRKRIYNESNCIDKIKITIRSWFERK